jgi:glucosamine kinase
MVLYLGLDGGGTGCRAAVADDSGRILGRAEAGPANIASDPDTALANILTAARQALIAAVGEARAGAELSTVQAGMGLAGANADGAVARLTARLPFAARVETDAIAAAKGALGARDGIVAALGTGSVFARQQGGQIQQIGGWGLVLGDEGSGAYLGRGLLAQALRAVDGYVPMTPLLREVLAEQGGPTGVVRFAQDARPADFAALAPRLLDSADPAAARILAAADADVARAVERLQTDPVLPVIFLGGLGAAFAQRLAGRWPILPAAGSVLDGALMIAREAH